MSDKQKNYTQINLKKNYRWEFNCYEWEIISEVGQTYGVIGKYTVRLENNS